MLHRTSRSAESLQHCLLIAVVSIMTWAGVGESGQWTHRIKRPGHVFGRPLLTADGPFEIAGTQSPSFQITPVIATSDDRHFGPDDLGEPFVGPQEYPISADSLKGDIVVIDGAAEKAELLPDKPEKKQPPATEQASFAWIAGKGNQLGMLEWVERDLSVVNYAMADHTELRAAPGFAMRWLDGPATTDLPPYLFSIYVDTAVAVHINQSWVIDTVISPSWNTDFANKGYQLFRLPWQIVNTFTMTDDFKLVLGVLDMDREDIHFLPVVGFSYIPTEGNMQLDAIFPRPKAAWRLSNSADGSYWGYVSGEIGGGSFNILRADRRNDIVTLRDYRLLCGLEWRGTKRHATRIEAGWVFGRAVEYQSNIGNYNPGDTAIIRISSDY